jgi:NADH-quinone oxidoreductase subunit E
VSFHPEMEYAPARFHRSERKLADEGPPFAYTPENQAKFDENVTRYPADQRKSAILFALYLAQGQQGYLTGNAMAFVAGQIGCSRADVEDVVSYYTMFYTKPVGKHVLNVCRTLSCALLGAERVTEELSAKLGIRPGETTADGMFTLIEVECLGACDRAPVVMVNDDWHERLAPEQVAAFVEGLKAQGPRSLTGCHLHAEDKAGGKQ